VYKPRPLHDHNSHWADAFRYLAISLPKTRDGTSPEELNARYAKAMAGPEAHLPKFFQQPKYGGAF